MSSASSPRCPLDPLAPGDRILGRYVVERVIGEGGMGRVYAVRHLELGRPCALKVLLGGADPAARRKFAREARAAANLTSPHVARVFDTGELPGGVPFMLLELLEGKDLSALLARPIPDGASACIALQVLDALADAHDAYLVHRDLKPGNVFLVGADLERPNAKVLDFGIAKDLGGRTGEGLAGTPRYIAPEQLRDGAIDGRVDLWALGVLLFECLTGGTSPFAGATIADTFSAILLRQAPALPPSVDPRLAAVVSKALAKDPRDRFGCAGEMAAALLPLVPSRMLHLVPRRWSQGLGPRRPTTRIRLPNRRRGWLGIAAASALAIALLAGALSRAPVVASSPPLLTASTGAIAATRILAPLVSAASSAAASGTASTAPEGARRPRAIPPPKPSESPARGARARAAGPDEANFGY